MNILAWSKEYSLNIAQIDSQHQKLVSLVGSLFQAMREGKGKEVLSRILADVINYTQTHFRTEEQLLSLHGYPECAGHKKEHEVLTKHALTLQERFRKGEAALTVEVAEFLKNWLVNHILKMDKHYAPFLLSKGVK
jgi:hemerythrin-like metal-binding protein